MRHDADTPPQSATVDPPPDRPTRMRPSAVSRFVGRARETAEVLALLQEERLVTLVGTGGIGKTRLALHVADIAEAAFADGVRWLDLAPLSRTEDLAPTVLRRFVTADPGGGRALEVLAARIGSRHQLLVLDNCEQVVSAVAELCVTLLASCPSVHILATSRAPLETAAEMSWRIPSMSTPDPTADLSELDLGQFDATALFVDRARRVRSNVDLDGAGRRAVVELCSRLHGIPLAIELAAVRCRSLEPAQVLNGLDDTMGLLVGSGRAVDARHRTMEASISWSYDLLAPADRRTLRQLSAFAGSFSIEAAGAVTGDGVAALDAIERLVTCSLVELDARAGRARYRLLEPIRQFARRELRAVDEQEGTSDELTCVQRHRDYFVTIVHGLNQRFVGHDVNDVALWLVDERDEVRAILDRMAEARDWAAFGSVVFPLGIEWASRGLIRQVLMWLDRYLDATSDDVSSTRARVLYARGNARLGMGDFVAAAADLSASVEMGRVVGDDLAAGRSSSGLSFVLALVDPAAATPLVAEAIERLERAGDVFSRSRAYCNQAIIHLATGRFAEADDSLATAGVLLGGLPPEHHWGWVWLFQGVRASFVGDHATALRRAAQTEEATERLQIIEFRALIVHLRAMAAVERGEHHAAIGILETEVQRTRSEGVGLVELWLRRTLGYALHAAGELERAARTFEAVAAESNALGVAFVSAWSTLHLADVRDAQGDAAGALSALDVARPVLARLGNPQFDARSEQRRAALHTGSGSLDEAERLATDALRTQIRLGDRFGVVTTLDLLQVIAGAGARWRDVARFGAVGGRSRAESLLSLRLEPERSRVDAAVAAARDHLGDAYDEEVDAARLLQPLDMVASSAEQRHAASPRADDGADALSPAELRVAALIGEGLTNAEIGQRLYLSRETVKTHISHILTKLAVSNRAQIVARLARHDGPG